MRRIFFPLFLREKRGRMNLNPKSQDLESVTMNFYCELNSSLTTYVPLKSATTRE